MATGDLKNNLRILNSELKKLSVPANIYNSAELSVGNTDAFLDIFNHILQWYSPVLSRLINSKGLKPSSKEENRIKFLEGVYLIFRELFNWKPPLSVTQFLSSGFHERKVIMCTEVVRLVGQKIQELDPKAVKKQQITDTGHSGLKLILKKPKKAISVQPLKEKDMNINKSVFEACDTKCGLMKGGSCVCKSSLMEKSVRETSLASAGGEENNLQKLQYADGSILAELAKLKLTVLNKFETLESSLSGLESRIKVVENALHHFKPPEGPKYIPSDPADM